tara:strand:- start:1542 stop:2534 length:993 start_codon:yes stop_codon:yes gene_type:complete
MNDLSYKVPSIVVAVLVFFISLILFRYHTGGDQSVYVGIWNELEKLDFSEGRKHYQKYLTSQELVHFLLVDLFSKIIEKSIFMSFCNSLLAYSLMLLFRKLRVHYLIAVLIVLTNYYLYVLYLPAERLKFGIIFLVLSIYYLNNYKNFLSFAVLAFLSHFSVLIIYVSILWKYFLIKFSDIFTKHKMTYSLLLLIIFLLLAGILFGGTIVDKSINYVYTKQFDYLGVRRTLVEYAGLKSLIKPTIFLIASLIYAKNKTDTILIFIPLIIGAFIIGDDRVNMFCYFIFMYGALQYRNGFNLGILLSCIYFGIKSYSFVYQVIKYGNGFWLV